MISPIPYRTVPTTGRDALAVWERIRSEGAGWPVVVGDGESLARIAAQVSASTETDHEECLTASSRFQFPNDLAMYEALECGEVVLKVGEWPQKAPASPGLSVACAINGQPLDEVHILVAPTNESAAMPALLNWGGWNACPYPQQIVSTLRSWHQRYGAELIRIADDVMNVRAARRPATRDEALNLAREHYLFCPDIVDQGTGTLSSLAAMLMQDDWWFFWWD